MATSISAATIIENFDYGDTGGELLQNYGAAGGGWAGGWTAGSTPAEEGALYSSVNLTYSATGYNNLGNSASTGSAVHGTGDAGDVKSRAFASSLGGTVWASTLVRYESASADALLWLTSDTTTNNFISLRNSAPQLRVGGTTTTGTSGSYPANSTYLLLTRVTFTGGDDTIDFWVNPDMTGGATGLGAPTLSDMAQIGTALTGLRISTENANSHIDAIRVSNDPDGFIQVTAIPEPSSLMLLGLGAAGLWIRRRKI